MRERDPLRPALASGSVLPHGLGAIGRQALAIAIVLSVVPLMGVRCPQDVQMCEYDTDCLLPDYCIRSWSCGAAGCTTDDDCPEGVLCLQPQLEDYQSSCHRPHPETGRFVCQNDDGCPAGTYCEPVDLEGAAYTDYIGLCMPVEDESGG